MYGDQFGEFVCGYGNFLFLSPPGASLSSMADLYHVND